MRTFKTSLVGAMTIAMILGSGASVVAQEAETPTGIVAPGPLGVSYADWGSRIHSWLTESHTPDGIDCALGDMGAVHFMPGDPNVDCTVRSDQHILVMVGVDVCATDATLADKAAKAKGKKAKTLAKRRQADLAKEAECIADAGLADPLLEIDGESIVLDGFWVTTSPFVHEGWRYRNSGYFLMLEPLSVGNHTILSGFTYHGLPDPELRSLRNIEVVEAE